MRITPFHLVFEPEIKQLEKTRQWYQAAKMTYQTWKKNPRDLNALLCAGTQAWRGIMENENSQFNPEDGRPFDAEKDRVMTDMLREEAEWGCKNYSENAVFNAYFGYLMVVMPYFFGDYIENEEKGRELLKKAYSIEPDNPLVKVFYFRTMKETQRASDACAEIWKIYTPEQWGDSAVQSYFRHILRGD